MGGGGGGIKLKIGIDKAELTLFAPSQKIKQVVKMATYNYHLGFSSCVSYFLVQFPFSDWFL